MQKSSTKKHILTLGMWSFPCGTAAVQKLMYMARAFTIEGHTFTVVSHKFVKRSTLTKNLQRSGHIFGTEYLTTSPYVFSPKGIHKKIYATVVGLIAEFIWVLKHRKQLDRVILYSYEFLYILFWSKLLRILKIPVYLVYFELRSSVSIRRKFSNRLNDKLLDTKSFGLTQGVFTISDLLNKQVAKFSPGTTCFKIPPLVDFDEYDKIICNSGRKYFLYCGSLAYHDVVDFIIEAFKTIMNETKTNLRLVINGQNDVLNQYKLLAENTEFKDRIEIFSGLTNEELIENYKNAYALLIPLRKTNQDKARFPQKIAEYCASKRPFITTAVGEVVNYFDKTSAYIADNFEIKAYASEMLKASLNEKEADEIGEKSYSIGKKFFDFKAYTKPMLKFMHLDT